MTATMAYDGDVLRPRTPSGSAYNVPPIKIVHAATVYVLFPNTALTIQNDHVDVFRIYPSGRRVDETVMYMDFYIPEPAHSDKAVQHWEKNVDLLMRTVETQDFPMGEDIQRGIGSGAQDYFTYGRFEPALGHYHRAVREALGYE